MDLFDDLDTEPVARKTFTVNVDISAPVTAENSPDAVEENTTLATSPLGDEKPHTDGPPKVNMFDSMLSAVSRVKNRLEGKPEDEQEALDDTQPIQTHSQQDDDKSSATQKIVSQDELAETQPVSADVISGEEPTQAIEQESSSEIGTTQIHTEKEPSTGISPKPNDASKEELKETQPIQTTPEETEEPETEEPETEEPETQVIREALDSKDGSDSEMQDEDEEDEDVVTTTRAKKSTLFVQDDEEEDQMDDEVPENADADTQQVATDKPPSLDKLFVSDSESDTEQLPERTQAEEKEDRLRRIQARAEQKKTERLLKQQNEKDKNSKDLDNDAKAKQQKKTKKTDLEADIANDQGEDEGDEDFRSEDEDQEDERNVTFDIEVNTVKKFAKSDLFAAFAQKKAAKATAPTAVVASKPTPAGPERVTSAASDPTPKNAEIDLGSDSGSDSDDDLDVMDLVKNGVKESKKAPLQAPLKMHIPPAASKTHDTIDLDDSDSDIDVDVPLSKSKVLDIKARFSKRSMEIKKAKQKNASVSKNSVFAMLRAASKKQIHADLKERQGTAPELSKGEIDEVLDVESLLLKHMKHANLVKEQEDKSTRSQRLSAGHDDSEDDANYSEVPDSDVAESDDGGEDDEEDEDEDEDEDEEMNDQIPSSQMPKSNPDGEEEESHVTTKSRRKNVIDDEEDEDDDENKENIENIEPSAPKINIMDVLGNANKDDSINIGFFGGNFSQGQTQQLKNDLGISMTQLFDKGSPKAKVYGSKVFEDLRERNGVVLGDVSSGDLSNVNDSIKEDDSFYYPDNNQEAAPIDYDEPATQLADLEPSPIKPTMSIPQTASAAPSQTQADIATMRDTTTQADSLPQDTQDDTKLIEGGEEDDDDEDEVVEKPRQKKRLMKKSDLSDIDSESENEEGDDDAEAAERLRMAEIFKEQRRKDQLAERRRKKEMKAKGIDVMMENEADESEDEWAGVGGADGERDFEMDSEDEKMFDDITKVKQNRADLAKKLHDESAESDQKMLMKILKDLETGNWKKRGNNDEDGLDYDDEEDELIRRYRLYKQQKKRQMLEEDSNLRQLAKNKKSQAFFQSITEDSQNDVFAGQESETVSESEEDEEDDPFVDKTAKDKLKSPEDVSRKTKKRTITQAYVQKSLSFLNDMEEDAPEGFGGYLDEDDSFEDLHTLKQNSIISMADKTPQRKKTIVIDDQHSSPSDLFKIPSMKRSFQSLNVTAVRNTEVTFSTSAKTVSGSGSSIMSLGRGKSASKIDIKTQRVLKAQKLKKQVKTSGGGVLKRMNSIDSSAFE